MNKKRDLPQTLLRNLAPPLIGFFLFLFVAYPLFKGSQRQVPIFVQETFNGVAYDDLSQTKGEVYKVSLTEGSIVPEKIYIKEGDIIRFTNKSTYTVKLYFGSSDEKYTLSYNEDFFKVFKENGDFTYTAVYSGLNKNIKGVVYVKK